MDIVQWNCNGFYARLPHLKLLINNLNPQILCIQETNFKNNSNAKIRGYRTSFYNRRQAQIASGGVAIFTKNEVFIQDIPLQTTLEAVAIKVRINCTITICNIYLPNSISLNIAELDNILAQLPKPFIILGDFNSHNNLWGSTTADRRGKLIEEWLDNHNDLVILNTGTPTHFNVSNGTESVIDLSFASTDIATKLSWASMQDLYDSDHYPLSINWSIQQQKIEQRNRPKWIINRANWPLFQYIINNNINNLKVLDSPQQYEINTIVGEFITLITEAAKQAIPQTTGKVMKRQVPWWNEECTNAIKEKKRAFRKFKKSKTIENCISYKKARAKARLTLKTTMVQSWQQFTSSITNKTAISEVWHKVKIISGSNTYHLPRMLIDKNGEKQFCPEAMSNLLADSFAKNSSNSNYEPTFLAQIASSSTPTWNSTKNY